MVCVVPEGALGKSKSSSHTGSSGGQRAKGDVLKVTGSGVIYVENPADFIASKRVQRTIATVNKGIEKAAQKSTAG